VHTVRSFRKKSTLDDANEFRTFAPLDTFASLDTFAPLEAVIGPGSGDRDTDWKRRWERQKIGEDQKRAFCIA
jgi:hypothetical protein